jgi:hypothetical protein
MAEEEKPAEPAAGISYRALDIGVALAFMVVAAIVIADSQRLGSGWGRDGPRAGYFPFYIGLVMLASAAIVLFQAIVSRAARKVVMENAAMRSVARLLVPTVVYVALIAFIGIYVASAIYLAYFMSVLGKYKPLPVAAVAIAIPVALFFLFEVWFLVPLPKGPLEDYLGY